MSAHRPRLIMIGTTFLQLKRTCLNGSSQITTDGAAAITITLPHISAATASDLGYLEESEVRTNLSRRFND